LFVVVGRETNSESQSYVNNMRSSSLRDTCSERILKHNTYVTRALRFVLGHMSRSELGSRIIYVGGVEGM
jgi:hypothetical protein